jgi:hypothetical protein
MCRADQRLAPIAIGEHFHQLGDVVLACMRTSSAGSDAPMFVNPLAVLSRRLA